MPDTPSEAAMRAAREILNTDFVGDDDEIPYDLAELIDRETGLPKLLSLLHELRHAICLARQNGECLEERWARRIDAISAALAAHEHKRTMPARCARASPCKRRLVSGRAPVEQPGGYTQRRDDGE